MLYFQVSSFSFLKEKGIGALKISSYDIAYRTYVFTPEHLRNFDDFESIVFYAVASASLYIIELKSLQNSQ